MGDNILSGKFVKSVITTTTGAVTKKGTDLVKSINPHPQQKEVASPEASQGMASNILGSVWYQQAQSKETAGEVADTSEAIEAETSSNQEVINETGVEENNSDFTLQTFDDDVYVSPPPLEDDIPSHTSLPSPFEKVVFPPPPLPQVDDIPEPPPSPVDDAFQNIIQEANPDTKKSRLEQFFTPNNDKETTLKKANLILKDLKNSAPNKIIKDALEAFLKNPSNDKDVFEFQYNLASNAIEKKILNTDDKTLQNLFSPSDDKITRETQYSVLKNNLDFLKLFAGVLDINKNSLKVALDVFLQTPSKDNDTFKVQCDLAKTAVVNGILKAEEQTDKEIITKFLQTPGKCTSRFRAQCNLAKAIKADDEIFEKLFSPSKNLGIILTQKSFMRDMLKNKINADSDDSQIAFAKAALLKFLPKDDNMNDDFFIQLTQIAVEKGILKADDKEIIINLLKNPSSNKDVLIWQSYLASSSVLSEILNKDDKNIIINLLKKPSDDKEVLKYKYKLANTLIKNGLMEPEELKEVLDKIKNLILEQKITVAKNLSSLTNDQLKSIDEAMLLQDSENENK